MFPFQKEEEEQAWKDTRRGCFCTITSPKKRYEPRAVVNLQRDKFPKMFILCFAREEYRRSLGLHSWSKHCCFLFKCTFSGIREIWWHSQHILLNPLRWAVAPVWQTLYYPCTLFFTPKFQLSGTSPLRGVFGVIQMQVYFLLSVFTRGLHEKCGSFTELSQTELIYVRKVKGWETQPNQGADW